MFEIFTNVDFVNFERKVKRRLHTKRSEKFKSKLIQGMTLSIAGKLSD